VDRPEAVRVVREDEPPVLDSGVLEARHGSPTGPGGLTLPVGWAGATVSQELPWVRWSGPMAEVRATRMLGGVHPGWTHVGMPEIRQPPRPSPGRHTYTGGHPTTRA
jgi:hypothetical protein